MPSFRLRHRDVRAVELLPAIPAQTGCTQAGAGRVAMRSGGTAWALSRGRSAEFGALSNGTPQHMRYPMNETYALKGGFKTFFWIIGIIAVPIFLLGIPVIMIAMKAYAKVDENGLEYWWLTTKNLPWSELQAVHRAPASGVLGVMLNPQTLTRTNGKKMNIPVGAFEGSDQLLATLQSHVPEPSA